MNEFTKEELIDLQESWCCHYGKDVDTDELAIKIQSMIDNYCEHENQGSISDADYVYYCKDCNAITGI